MQITRASLLDADLEHYDLGNLESVIGVAGANVGNYGERLAESLPFRSCQIERDSTIALRGALASDDGVIAAIGTGSIFVAQCAGEIKSIGGWGNVVGDQASGVWLGKRLLHDTLLCFDGIYPESQLYIETMNHFGNSAESIVEFAKDATPFQFASFAKSVMNHAASEDSMAKRIVQSAVSDIELILGKIGNVRDLPVCLLGSVGVRYGDHLSEHVKDRLINAKGDAVAGAIALARERYCRQVSTDRKY